MSNEKMERIRHDFRRAGYFKDLYEGTDHLTTEEFFTKMSQYMSKEDYDNFYEWMMADDRIALANEKGCIPTSYTLSMYELHRVAMFKMVKEMHRESVSIYAVNNITLK